MSAAPNVAPGVAKVRQANRPHPTVCRDERHDGDPEAVGWVNPEGICAECLKVAPRCASPEHRGRWRVGAVLVDELNAEGHCAACARAMPTVRRNGERQDARHGIALEVFPRKELTIGFGTMRDYLAAFAVAPLANTMRRVLVFALENTDGPTWVCFRHRGYFLFHLGTGKAATRTILQDLELEGVLVRHYFPRGDSRLVPGSTEAKEGCSLLEWALLPGPELDAALTRAAQRNRARKNRRKKREKLIQPEQVRGDRDRSPEPPRGDRDTAPGDRDTAPLPSVIPLNDQDPDLDQDPCLDRLSLPSRNPPTSALALHEGDPPHAQTNPPEERGPCGALAASPLAPAEIERAESPAATRLASAHEAPRSEATSLPKEGCGEGESPGLVNASGTRNVASPLPSAIAVPDASSADGGAFPWETLKGFVRLALGAKLVGVTPGPLLGLLAKMHKRGWGLEDLEAFVVGVARGGGEAAAARAQAAAPDGVNPFRYATANPELYAHEGRKVLEGDAAAGTAERTSAVYARAAEAKATPAAPLSLDEQLRQLAAKFGEEDPQ
jgi:hypothetical protein